MVNVTRLGAFSSGRVSDTSVGGASVTPPPVAQGYWEGGQWYETPSPTLNKPIVDTESSFAARMFSVCVTFWDAHKMHEDPKILCDLAVFVDQVVMELR